MQIPRWFQALTLLLLLLPAAEAKVLVLVHGWAADADTWIHSGVMQVLRNQGWQDAGVVQALPAGVHYFPAYGQQATQRIYRVALPAHAPLEIQAAHLQAVLAYLQQQTSQEPIYLVGHSAGGLVSRMVAIRPQSAPIHALITIASPHLGTSRAIEGLDTVHDKPFFCPGPGFQAIKYVLGGEGYRYLDASQDVLVDLLPAAPGNLIAWLNLQYHPDISYHAVIRSGPFMMGDELVPAFSQDLNHVPAIEGRAKRYFTPAGHSLVAADGLLIAHILQQLPAQAATIDSRG